jgi:hypothetical protein
MIGAEARSPQRASFIMLALISSKTEKAYHEREEIATAIALARESERRHKVCLSIWTIWPSNSQPFPMVFFELAACQSATLEMIASLLTPLLVGSDPGRSPEALHEIVLRPWTNCPAKAW